MNTYSRAMAEKIAKAVLRAYNGLADKQELRVVFDAAEEGVREIITDCRLEMRQAVDDAFEFLPDLEIEDA